MNSVQSVIKANNTLLQTIIKGRTDPLSWIKENIKINHPARGVIPFDLYEFQEKTIKLIIKKHFVITLKSRQTGMSTVMQAVCLWSALHYTNYNVLIISAGQRNATSFLGKIKSMYDLIEPDNPSKVELSTDNKQQLIFKNGSCITALPATSSSTRGESINLLVVDEAAFIKNIDEVYRGMYPTLSRAFKGSKGKPYGIVIISTPNGISGDGEWYYKMYNGAISKTNMFIPVKIHWSEVPEYDKKWFLDQCRQFNWNYRSISAELELGFVSSGNTYIPGKILDSIQTTEPAKKLYDEEMWIWEEPITDVPYLIGCDVAYGNGGDSDYCTIQVINGYTLNQAAEFCSNKINISKFAEIIVEVARYFNNAITNIERNNVGKVLIEKILENTGGLNINLFKNVNENENENNHLHSEKKSYIGTEVTGKSRDVILSNMYNTIIDEYMEVYTDMMKAASSDDSEVSEEHKLKVLLGGENNKDVVKKDGIIKSERLLHEFLGFICDDHGRPEGSHDDLIFGFVHSLWAYAKCKHLILHNVVEVMDATLPDIDEKDQLIKFNKKLMSKLYGTNSGGVMSDMTIEEVETLLDNIDEEALNDYALESNGKVNSKDSLVAVWNNF